MRRSAAGGFRGMIIYLVIIAVSLVILQLTDTHKATKHQKRSSTPVRFIDETGTMPPDYVYNMNGLLRGIFMETGVDMRFLIVNSLHGQSLEDYAVAQARSRGIGAATDRRGLLCIYDTEAHRMRIEVGPKLEDIFTDAFISYLERENVRAYANANDLGLGLRFTARIILWRIRSAELGMNYDPRPAKMILDHQLLAEGAGATASLGAASPGDGAINRMAPPDMLEKYVPQPTVEDAWEKYQEWLLEPYEYTNVPLFTEDTQKVLANLTMSRAYLDSIFLGEHGQAHKVIVIGDLAMLYFTSTPLVSPYYFRRTENGWEMDIEGAIRNSQEIIGASYTWRWRKGEDAYGNTFWLYTVKIDGVDRIDGGDNRRLPVHDGLFNTIWKNSY